MKKIIGFQTGTSGVKAYVGLDNIALILFASATTVTIQYATATAATDVITLTFASDTTYASHQAIMSEISNAIGCPNKDGIYNASLTFTITATLA